MTVDEFKAVLALQGWELQLTGSIDTASQGVFLAPMFLARVVAPIKSDDVSQGPYRLEGMSRALMEIGARTQDEAVQALIKLYQEGHIK